VSNLNSISSEPNKYAGTATAWLTNNAFRPVSDDNLLLDNSYCHFCACSDETIIILSCVGVGAVIVICIVITVGIVVVVSKKRNRFVPFRSNFNNLTSLTQQQKHIHKFEACSEGNR